MLINQSINQNVNSAPSRPLLRGAPDSGQAEKQSSTVGETENKRRYHRMRGFPYRRLGLGESLLPCFVRRTSPHRSVRHQHFIISVHSFFINYTKLVTVTSSDRNLIVQARNDFKRLSLTNSLDACIRLVGLMKGHRSPSSI